MKLNSMIRLRVALAFLGACAASSGKLSGHLLTSDLQKDLPAGVVIQRDGFADPHVELTKRITSAPAKVMKKSGLAGAMGEARVRVTSNEPQEITLPIPQLADGQVPLCFLIHSTTLEAFPFRWAV